MTSTTHEPSLPDTDLPSIAIISGSARVPRIGPAVAGWVSGELAALTDARLDLIDVGEVPVPSSTDLQPGARRTDELARRIAAADGYVVVTPEYNHGYPASLKQLIDSHYREWMFKPVMLVGYGVTGGVLAAEQLRSVFAELHVVTSRKVVTISAPWGRISDGVLVPSATERDALAIAWSELRWWTTALRGPRNHEPYDADRS